MERLTIEYCGEYVPKGLCSIDRQGGADDCELCYENCKAMREGNDDCSGCVVDKCFDKLGKYEDLEEQGKLMKLPCAVGDTVYTNCSMQGWRFKRKDRPHKAEVVFIGINGTDGYIKVDVVNGNIRFSGIGKTEVVRENERTGKDLDTD